jgi:hypothetical protein
MMKNIKPGCEMLPEKGLLQYYLPIGKATPSQPTLPMYLYSAMTLHDIYNVPDSNGRAGENKGIYKYIQKYIKDKRKEGTTVPINGI